MTFIRWKARNAPWFWRLREVIKIPFQLIRFVFTGEAEIIKFTFPGERM
jgi:hypothetical protein